MAFQNINKKYITKPVEVLCEVKLKSQYNVSLNTLIEMIKVHDMRLISSGIMSPKAIVTFTLEKFKKLFQKDPIIDTIYRLSGTEKFAESFKVIEIGKSCDGKQKDEQKN